MISSAERFDADTLELETLTFSRDFSDPLASEEIANRLEFTTEELEQIGGAELGWYFPLLEDNIVVPAFTWIFALVGLPAVVLLPLLFLMFMFRPRNSSDGALGFGPPVVTLVGMLLGTVAVASVNIWAEIFLDPWVTADFAVIRAAALVLMALTTAIVLLASLVAYIHAGWKRKERASAYASEFWQVAAVDAPAERQDADWLNKLDMQRRLRWVGNWLMSPLAVLSGLGLVALAAYLWDPDWLLSLLDNELKWLRGLAAFVALTFLPGMFLIVWKSQRIGHLWDILTFWPGWGHPFAPPSYAMRAVPEIANRVTNRLTGPVVLAGHSQGSVLAATVVAGLPPDVRRRVALLTYGSPLVRLYQRAFPDYFGADEMALLADALTDEGAKTPRWRNVFRPSDQIAAPIMSPDPDLLFCVHEVDDEVDVVASDPYPHPGQAPAPGDPMPGIKGHSDYPEDPPYQAAADKLWQLLERQVIDLRDAEPEVAVAPSAAVPADG